jgi:small subunit ribosomal protein S9
MDPRPESIEKTKEITSNNTMNTIFQKDKIGVGKRKRAVARVFLVPGTGKITINKVSGEKYLQYNTNYLNAIWSPLEKLALKDNFDIITLVRGGGLTGQTDAIKLGVARLICKMGIENENRIILKPFGFLSRDARIKERKKYGLRKARKASQYSKR